MDVAEKETVESLNVNPRAQAPPQGDSSPEGDPMEESSLSPGKPSRLVSAQTRGPTSWSVSYALSL